MLTIVADVAFIKMSRPSQTTYDDLTTVMANGSVVMLLLVFAFYLWLKFKSNKPTKKKLPLKDRFTKETLKKAQSKRR